MAGRKIGLALLGAVAYAHERGGPCGSAGAFNKSVTVAISVTIPARGSDGSTSGQPARRHADVLHLQPGTCVRQGRPSGRRMQERTEKGPGEANMRISGNSMVGVVILPSGAMQLTINFDPSFSSCSARVVIGAERRQAHRLQGAGRQDLHANRAGAGVRCVLLGQRRETPSRAERSQFTRVSSG